MEEFDKIKWKTADDLTPQEADIIVANQDKLNDEEKAAFADLITASTPLPDNPLDDAINQAVDGTVTTPAESLESKDSTIPKQPEAVTPVIPENVVTADNLDAYLEKKKEEWDKAGKSAVEQKAEEAKIQKFFDEGYKPADWNDYTNAAYEKLAPLIEQRVMAKLDAQNREFYENQEKLKATQKEIFDRFETEFATLAKNKLIPDPKEAPEAYKKVHDSIIAIGDAHNKSNVTDAYKLWSIIPETHGGGLKTSASTIEAQKEAAGKIGSGRGVASGGHKGPPSYAKVHGMSMDELIEQRLQQPS